MSTKSAPVAGRRSRVGVAPWSLRWLSKLGPLFRAVELVTAARFTVRGESMRPNFENDQYVLVSKLTYLMAPPSRGDVVVLQHPYRHGWHYIKRIVGLPGECVEVRGGVVRIDGEPLEEPYVLEGHEGTSLPWEHSVACEWPLGKGEFYMMGDNRADSDDSRAFGPVPRENIIGKAWLRYWPRQVWGVIRDVVR